MFNSAISRAEVRMMPSRVGILIYRYAARPLNAQVQKWPKFDPDQTTGCSTGICTLRPTLLVKEPI
jgi:hypothetical protein